MLKCAIFDLDGTLTQSEEGIFNCVRYAAEKLGFTPPDPVTLRKFVGPPLDWSFREYMGMDEKKAERAVVAYRERYETVGLFENRVYPGIRRLLRMLKGDGWYIGVATGKPQRSSERILTHFGLDKFLDTIAGPLGGHTADKVDLITRALPEKYDAAWMVGDRRFDIEGARGVGIHSVGVGYGYGTEEELRNAGCDAYCATVQEVIDFFCPGVEPPKGHFLSMEGLDGSGKTTQMNLLEDALLRFGFEVERTREPGGCPISEKIRALVLDVKNEGMEDLAEAYLYAAARAQHVRQRIRPVVKAGKIVLCDRFLDSSVAYQGGGRGLGVENVLKINQFAVDGTLPEMTVYLDIRHEEALARRAAATALDRMEAAGEDFHARVEAGYHELIRRDPARFVVVDAALPPEEIAKNTAERVIRRLMEAE